VGGSLHFRLSLKRILRPVSPSGNASAKASVWHAPSWPSPAVFGSLPPPNSPRLGASLPPPQTRSCCRNSMIRAGRRIPRPSGVSIPTVTVSPCHAPQRPPHTALLVRLSPEGCRDPEARSPAHSCAGRQGSSNELMEEWLKEGTFFMLFSSSCAILAVGLVHQAHWTDGNETEAGSSPLIGPVDLEPTPRRFGR
jgi:hypothetical protein